MSQLPSSLALSIIYAANARGTHHKLALDALDFLTGPDAEGWRRLFYKNAAIYAQGAKVPDDEFKDFQNHVLHVRDGYWGGAADKVENWYTHLVKALRGERWSEAVWTAGILSHYYTDPIHPFHTAQTEAENNIHRATEWSISRAYDELAERGRLDYAAAGPQLTEGPGWLRKLVCEGAETGNKQYEKLIAHYDIHRGVVDPPAGLDFVSERLVAELISYATHGLAALLGRAIAEAGTAPPQVSLGLDIIRAMARLPRNWMLARTEDKAERKIVEAMYDELKATGKVDKTLPEDERVVREVYAREVLVPQLAERDKARGEIIALPGRYERGYTVATPQTAKAPPAPAHAPSQLQPEQRAQKPVLAPVAETPAPAPQPQPVAAAPAPSAPAPRGEVIEAHFGERDSATPRVYLQPADDVEKAPSIGPKMAERLYALKIKTVADLLATDADQLSLDLDAKNVWDETVRDWQDQARMVCQVPGLRGTHAQLLVGAGFRTRDALTAAAADKLCADVLTFAVSAAGQRILRDGNPPDVEKIRSWLDNARAAKVA